MHLYLYVYDSNFSTHHLIVIHIYLGCLRQWSYREKFFIMFGIALALIFTHWNLISGQQTQGMSIFAFLENKNIRDNYVEISYFSIPEEWYFRFFQFFFHIQIHWNIFCPYMEVGQFPFFAKLKPTTVNNYWYPLFHTA